MWLQTRNPKMVLENKGPETKKDKEVLSKKLSVIRTLNESRIAPVRFMDELTSVMPDRLWLDKVQESNWKLKMSGMGINQYVIADFMSNMEKNAMFTNVKLKKTSKQDKGGMTLMQFDIEAEFVPPKYEEE